MFNVYKVFQATLHEFKRQPILQLELRLGEEHLITINCGLKFSNCSVEVQHHGNNKILYIFILRNYRRYGIAGFSQLEGKYSILFGISHS